MSEGVNTHAGVTAVNIVALAASKQVFPCSQHPAAKYTIFLAGLSWKPGKNRMLLKV